MEARVGLANNVAAIRSALELTGIEFINGEQPGVRLRKAEGKTRARVILPTTKR